jgi:hypothetical protein
LVHGVGGRIVLVHPEMHSASLVFSRVTSELIAPGVRSWSGAWVCDQAEVGPQLSLFNELVGVFEPH